MEKQAVALLLALALLLSWQAHATSFTDTTSTTDEATNGVALQVGTTGIGIQLAHQLPTKSRLVARLGLSYLAYRKAILLHTEDDGKLTIQPDLIASFAIATLKWYPFSKSDFFVAAGGGYAWHPYLGLSIRANNTITFGGLQMTPENVGVIDAKFRWTSIVGYAGLGYGRSIPNRRLGFMAELGCYYLGVPKIDLQYEGFLDTTTIQDQLPTIQRNLSGYRYLPSLQFSVTYAIH